MLFISALNQLSSKALQPKMTVSLISMSSQVTMTMIYWFLIYSSSQRRSQKQFFSVSNGDDSLSAMLLSALLKNHCVACDWWTAGGGLTPCDRRHPSAKCTVTSHHSPKQTSRWFSTCFINVADMIIVAATQRVGEWVSEWMSERLADVASFERFAGDLSQFGHEMFVLPLRNALVRYLQVNLWQQRHSSVMQKELNINSSRVTCQWPIPAVSPTPSSLDSACRPVCPSRNLPQTPALLVQTPQEGPEAPPFWVPLH